MLCCRAVVDSGSGSATWCWIAGFGRTMRCWASTCQARSSTRVVAPYGLVESPGDGWLTFSFLGAHKKIILGRGEDAEKKHTSCSSGQHWKSVVECFGFRGLVSHTWIHMEHKNVHMSMCSETSPDVSEGLTPGDFTSRECEPIHLLISGLIYQRRSQAKTSMVHAEHYILGFDCRDSGRFHGSRSCRRR